MGTCIRRMGNVLLVNISLMPEYMSLIKCFTSLSALREHSEARFHVSEHGCGSDCLGSDSTVCAIRVCIKKNWSCQHQLLTPVILATQEAEIRSIKV
jgi:hypothetical protein